MYVAALPQAKGDEIMGQYKNRRGLRSVPKTRTIVHTCSCGEDFTKEEWRALPLCGVFVDDTDASATWETGVPGRFALLEQRNCKCGSTRAVPIGVDAAIALVNECAVRLRRTLGGLETIRTAIRSIPEVIADHGNTLRGLNELFLERERCARVADSAGDKLRELQRSKPGKAMARELGARADLCQEIAAEIRKS